MLPSAWFPQQLVGFLEAVWSASAEARAALTAVERAAEALDAEVAAIMSGDCLIAAVGYPEGAVPLRELSLLATAEGAARELAVPGVGTCQAVSVAMHHPPGATFMVARAGPDGGLRHDEASLLQGMARVTAMAMRTQRLLDDERAAREKSDRQATENARLLGALTQRQAQLTELADEQAALRRVATLVAAQAAPDQIFAAVAEEVCRVARADIGCVIRFDPDECSECMTVLAAWSRDGTHIPVSSPTTIEADGIAAKVLRSGRPERLDTHDACPSARLRDQFGIRSVAGAPILVGGRVWGLMAAGSRQPEPVPATWEQRLANFTELVATAISNAQTRTELARLAEEQAALRRVATLVATGVASDELFDAVTSEMRLLLNAGVASLLRYEPDGTATVVAASGGPGVEPPAHMRMPLTSGSVAAAVRDNGGTARIDGYDGPPGSIAAAYRRLGMRSSTGAPIIVEGSLWGAITADWGDTQAVPPGAEGRIAQFTQLVATAISNAASQAQLAASRARIVATADETRRRLERDLHDGIQQRLVTLALQIRAVQNAVPPEQKDVLKALSQTGDELIGVLDELREISRGVHPAILSQGGLGPALRSFARRSGVPVMLRLGKIERLPLPVEVAAYYVVAEALTNAAKHANATVAEVELAVEDATLHLSIRDDGDGGADPARGSGIIGLIDRVDALGGKMTLHSPPGDGTSLVIELPAELN